MNSSTLPIVLRDPKILLIGAGSVALQKAEVLTREKIDYHQITQDIIADFSACSANIQRRSICESDLASFRYIIDATGSEAMHSYLVEHKLRYGYLLNVVDVPSLCDFYFAALVTMGELKVAVSSSGASPTIAQEVRNVIKRLLPEKLFDLVKESRVARLKGSIEPNVTRKRVQKELGKVYLIGCGTGDVELLTLKAYRLIQAMDVVLIDHLISEEIKAIIPKATEVVYVGKQKSYHSLKQEEINALLIEYASKGLQVARLKSGDPYIFGRGAEEAWTLAEKSVRVEVVPGISSAIAGPMLAGIAPTARGYATSLSIVSAHLQGNSVNLDWVDMLERNNHTTIVLMGLSRASEILKHAYELDIDMSTPTAIISNASRENQHIVTGVLKDLESMAKKSSRPALLLFGRVVDLHTILPISGLKNDSSIRTSES